MKVNIFVGTVQRLKLNKFIFCKWSNVIGVINTFRVDCTAHWNKQWTVIHFCDTLPCQDNIHCDLWQCLHLIWDNTHCRLPSSTLKMVAYTLKITAQNIHSQSLNGSWVLFFQAVDGRAQRRQTAELTDSSSLLCTTTHRWPCSLPLYSGRLLILWLSFTQLIGCSQ